MRFYVPPGSISPLKDTAEIKDKTEVHHIRDVLRLQKGDVVYIFDGQGREFSCCIEGMKRDAVIVRIKEVLPAKDSALFNITLYQAIPKKTKMDFIVEKAVELGIHRIVPVITDRTVPEIKDKCRRKTERWVKIAIAASKQCGRAKIPLISDIMTFDDALIESRKSDLVLFAALDRKAEPLKSVLKNNASKNIAIFIGPEGDFSLREISLARDAGYNICSLGPLVLRCDTAALFMLSCINYELQD